MCHRCLGVKMCLNMTEVHQKEETFSMLFLFFYNQALWGTSVIFIWKLFGFLNKFCLCYRTVSRVLCWSAALTFADFVYYITTYYLTQNRKCKFKITVETYWTSLIALVVCSSIVIHGVPNHCLRKFYDWSEVCTFKKKHKMESPAHYKTIKKKGQNNQPKHKQGLYQYCH